MQHVITEDQLAEIRDALCAAYDTIQWYGIDEGGELLTALAGASQLVNPERGHLSVLNE